MSMVAGLRVHLCVEDYEDWSTCDGPDWQPPPVFPYVFVRISIKRLLPQLEMEESSDEEDIVVDAVEELFKDGPGGSSEMDARRP